VAVCAIPFALAQPNATKQRVAKPGSASKALVKVGSALPANIILVTNTDDSGTGSLRDALAVANDGDTIDATGVSGTILLTSGELQVTHNVTINGPGAANLALNGNATFRVFENFASNVTISGFTITNGLAADNNGGGGILNHGGLTVSESIVSNCATPAGSNQQGGGISNNPGATLTVVGSTINGNHAGCEGGGIYSSNAQLTVMDSTISGNSATSLLACGGNGGGLGTGGGDTTATVTDSTISGNVAGGLCEPCGVGGGISNTGQALTVTNSTISDNRAHGSGGGVWSGGNPASLTVINSTLSGNSSGNFGGGGISNGGNLTVTNSTLSGNLGFGKGGTIINEGATQIGILS
jgi:hypothetical protein